MSCCPIFFSSFRAQRPVTLPAGLRSVVVRNKGAGAVYVAGKEVCGTSNTISTPCGNCAGETLLR